MSEPLFAMGIERNIGLDVDELYDLLKRPVWHAEAVCRGEPQELFFPPIGASLAAARAVCAGCPVRAECAEAGRGEIGVWGGMSGEQRRKARRSTA